MTRACVVLLSLGLVLAGTATFDAAPPAAGLGPDAERAAQPKSAQSPGSDPAADALAEFPQFDRGVREIEQAALAIRAASLADRLPDSLEKLQAYLGVASGTCRDQSRITDALRTAGAVIEHRPVDAARVLELLMTSVLYDGEADARAALPGMLAAARDRIGGLPKDRAAELAYQANRVNAWLTRKEDDQALQSIVRDYAGTEAALQAELDLLGRAVGFDPWKRADAFARFAEEHPGTCAAASALGMEANEVGSNQGTSARASNADPTDRVLRALAIAGKLDSPPYKACRPPFSTGTPGYVFASKPTYAPGNIDRIVAAYSRRGCWRTRMRAAPGGAVLEKARWLVGVERRKDAVAVLSGFATRFPRSANLAEAQYLEHKARLYDALELLNVEGQTNEAAGMAALEALARESYDFPVTAATVVKDAGGRAVEVTLYQRFPGLDNVVLLDVDGLSFFATLMNKVGGTKKRAWTVDPQRDLQRGYLETPNQPVGPSVNLLALLNTSFPARAGHWGGWEFLTYPRVSEIRFTDEARTKGRVRVTIGYSGSTMLVEKQPDGTWKATGMTEMWVTQGCERKAASRR